MNIIIGSDITTLYYSYLLEYPCYLINYVPVFLIDFYKKDIKCKNIKLSSKEDRVYLKKFESELLLFLGVNGLLKGSYNDIKIMSDKILFIGDNKNKIINFDKCYCINLYKDLPLFEIKKELDYDFLIRYNIYNFGTQQLKDEVMLDDKLFHTNPFTNLDLVRNYLTFQEFTLFENFEDESFQIKHNLKRYFKNLKSGKVHSNTYKNMETKIEMFHLNKYQYKNTDNFIFYYESIQDAINKYNE